jgi:hypothetical protein
MVLCVNHTYIYLKKQSPPPHGLACDYQILTFHAKNNNNLIILKIIIIAKSIKVLQYICL